jgi:predicted thioesterase
MTLEIGLKGRADTLVTENNTASAVGSGLVPVFATPYMIALMENAAVNAVLPALAEDEGTVGTQLNVAHSAATPVGMKVWAEATLTAVEGKKLSFDVVAFDECGEIGRGTHERFIIKPEKFLAKCQAKLNG